MTLHIHFRVSVICPIQSPFHTLVAMKFWFNVGRADLVLNVAILNFLVPEHERSLHVFDFLIKESNAFDLDLIVV